MSVGQVSVGGVRVGRDGVGGVSHHIKNCQTHASMPYMGYEGEGSHLAISDANEKGVTPGHA